MKWSVPSPPDYVCHDAHAALCGCYCFSIPDIFFVLHSKQKTAHLSVRCATSRSVVYSQPILRALDWDDKFWNYYNRKSFNVSTVWAKIAAGLNILSEKEWKITLATQQWKTIFCSSSQIDQKLCVCVCVWSWWAGAGDTGTRALQAYSSGGSLRRRLCGHTVWTIWTENPSHTRARAHSVGKVNMCQSQRDKKRKRKAEKMHRHCLCIILFICGVVGVVVYHVWWLLLLGKWSMRYPLFIDAIKMTFPACKHIW